MKIVAIHDQSGELHALVVGPATEAPSGFVSQPGHLASLVEADIKHDLTEEELHRHLQKLLKHHRVDLGDARLVRRQASD
jgi:hypothetical protein